MKQQLKDSYKKLRGTNILSNFINLSSIQISNILLFLITIRIVTGNVGIEGFGLIMFAYRFSMLAGTVVNYGTNQSAVKDVALNLNDPKELSAVFYNTLWIRLAVFIAYAAGMLVFYWFGASYYGYLLLGMPIVLAEIFNPLCFFIGIEKIRLFNITNLAFNAVAVVAILIFIKDPADARWVNFILGMGNLITYLGLLMYFSNDLKLSFHAPQRTGLLKIAKDNFYLMANNVSANLQQSMIIFALELGGVRLLGAYTICDRIIGQCRNVLNIVSNAIYPKAANIYKDNSARWAAFRKRYKYVFAGVFFAGGVLIYVLADLIIFLLTKKHDQDTVMVLRVMAFVPFISSINVFNMLDMLLTGKNVYIFRIAMILLVIAAVAAFALVSIGNYLMIAAFTIIVEFCALLMCEYVVKIPLKKNG